ncbi:conserved hypothetical protein [Gammaproteobacteria bacterium]
MYLLGSILGVLLHQQGLLALHAGALEVRGQVVAFAGHSGTGKSTLVAHLRKRGYRMVSDDLLAVHLDQDGQPWVHPSIFRVKLWADALNHIDHLAENLVRDHSRLEKFHLPAAEDHRDFSLLLGQVFILTDNKDSDEIHLEVLRGLDAVNAIVKVTYRTKFVNALGLNKNHFQHCSRVANRIRMIQLITTQGHPPHGRGPRRIGGFMDTTGLIHSQGNIVWLASYPKSGNTWLRIVLGHLLGKSTIGDDNINQLPIMDSIASSRLFFDDIVDVNAADLPLNIVDNLRPRVYETISREANRRLYIKVHDAYLLTPDGEPMFPTIATWGVIHIVRNPLDVAISYAYHVGIDIDRAILAICDQGNSFCYNASKLPDQLHQRLLDWSSHAASWLNAPFPRFTVRYEDMLSDPQETFSAVARFCGLEITEVDVVRAVEASRIGRLQQLEGQRRFRETLRGNPSFFRRGVAGDWKTILTNEQVARTLAQHSDMMERLGYVTDL